MPSVKEMYVMHALALTVPSARMRSPGRGGEKVRKKDLGKPKYVRLYFNFLCGIYAFLKIALYYRTSRPRSGTGETLLTY